MLELASIISSCPAIQDLALEELSWMNVKTRHGKAISRIRRKSECYEEEN